MGIGSAIPWWGKIAAKVVLKRLPVGGRAWQRLNVFSPGFMLDAEYAIGVFRDHFLRAGAPPPGFRYLELGPGDSLATAAIAWAYGAAGGYLVDNGAYAATDITLYQPLLARLAALHGKGGGLAPVRDATMLQSCGDIDDLLRQTNATYREDGLASLRQVPAGSLDLVFSQAVLEHVPLAEFDATMQALLAALKSTGIASHRIDFKDHLGASLHNLRFAETFWEQPWFARDSGFYTNRLRFSQMIDSFRTAGFDIAVEVQDRWPALPLPRSRMAVPFRDLGDDDLLTSGATVTLRKR